MPEGGLVMTFQQLMYVVEISKCGSINKAANKLFLSQSAISTAVHELENELNITLFNRTNKGVELTADGREFLSFAVSLLEQKRLLESLYRENNNLTGDYAYADWGIYNPIENGGNFAGLWRVLTHEEWVYIIESRPNAGKLFGFATIDNQYKGVILLPDEWVLPSGVTFKPGTDCYMEYETGNGWRNLNLDMQTNYNDNKYTLAQWKIMEEAGAVFFPAMGYLTGGEIRYPNDYGYYASSSARNGYTEYAMEFDNKSLLASDGAARRGNGVSVRLVTNEGAGQGIDNINHKSETINHKFIKDGQLFIERNGKIINVLGQPVR